MNKTVKTILTVVCILAAGAAAVAVFVKFNAQIISVYQAIKEKAKSLTVCADPLSDFDDIDVGG